jgi:hypothetical protein
MMGYISASKRYSANNEEEILRRNAITKVITAPQDDELRSTRTSVGKANTYYHPQGSSFRGAKDSFRACMQWVIVSYVVTNLQKTPSPFDRTNSYQQMVFSVIVH